MLTAFLVVLITFGRGCISHCGLVQPFLTLTGEVNSDLGYDEGYGQVRKPNGWLVSLSSSSEYWLSMCWAMDHESSFRATNFVVGVSNYVVLFDHPVLESSRGDKR